MTAQIVSIQNLAVGLYVHANELLKKIYKEDNVAAS
jgi:hypothetical protein